MCRRRSQQTSKIKNDLFVVFAAIINKRLGKSSQHFVLTLKTKSIIIIKQSITHRYTKLR